MISIGVVADSRRGDMGAKLSDEVSAQFLSVDNGTLGCTGNHLTAWKWHADNPSRWAVVLEEDAVPVEDFREQLAAALDVAPAPIVSLYMGTGYIEDARTAALLKRADSAGANWILMRGRVLHAVAIAIRHDVLSSMISNVRQSAPIDRELSRWARRRGCDVAYSYPSLVDHADVPSLVTRYRRSQRRAWHLGTRDEWRTETTRMA